jgi:hypothetical protein
MSIEASKLSKQQMSAGQILESTLTFWNFKWILNQDLPEE